MEPIRLGVNVDHVATVRQARHTRYPDPVAAALIAEQSGADSITVHLREDRRHIQARDVEVLLRTVQTRVNLEMAVTDSMVEFAVKHRPADCCLVPERREELTTEGGLDVVLQADAVKDFIRQMHESAIRVSIFLDPDAEQVRKAKSIGADAVEINTGRYADAKDASRPAELARVADAAKLAARHKLEVLAGHGLNYVNVIAIAAIDEIVELNIGHSIVARAALAGMDRAVRDMVALLEGRPRI